MATLAAVRTARASLLVVTAALALLAGAGPAAAHDALVGSDPADGASLDIAPTQVRLAFTEAPRAAVATVTGPAGDRWEARPAEVLGNEVTVPLRPLGPAGVYTVGFRVVSSDGHPVTGTVRFILTQPGADQAGRAGQGGAGLGEDGAPPAAGDDGAVPAWPWIAGAAVLLVLGVGAALRISR